jgi:heat shock protein HslJ
MNKVALTIITILLATGLTLSACASPTTSASLSGTSWVLVSYGRAGSQTPAASGIRTSLIFGADGQVSGSLGCNGFSGNYQVNDGKLDFGPLASTMMACQEPQMTQESSAFLVLTGTVRFTLDGSTLTIFDTSGANALTLSRVVN